MSRKQIISLIIEILTGILIIGFLVFINLDDGVIDVRGLLMFAPVFVLAVGVPSMYVWYVRTKRKLDQENKSNEEVIDY